MKLAAALTALLVASTAHADTKADQLFEKGKKLLAQRRFSEACQAFEDSDKIDPEIGTKLNIAKCYEDWGKVATALKWYRLAEGAARQAKDDRLDKIHEHMQEVDSDTPRLTLRTNKDADKDAVVLLDGAKAKLDEAIEVDPGAHVVEYTNAAGEKKKKVIPVERGGSSDVKLDLPPKKAGTPDAPPTGGDEKPATKPVVVDDPGKGRRLAGYALGGVGVVGMGVSTWLTLTARSSYKDALASHCSGSTSACDAQGLTLTHDARSRANIATIVFVASAAAIAGGIVLYVTAPKATSHAPDEKPDDTAWYLAPSLAPDGGGLVLTGGF